jgi:ribonuclease M5
VGHKDSKSLRDKLSKELHIGHVNGKTLYQRLKAFGISKKDVCEVISCNTKPKKDTDKTF